METYQQEFVNFMVGADVLTFGDFTTKSGRKTPFFINTGKYRTGGQIRRLGEFYAQAIQAAFPERIDLLFGPAYKGIPLVTTASIALERDHGREIAFCFNRKEAKDHGEGGVLIGHKLQDGDKVLIVEDVTTAGTSIRETVPILKAAADVEIVGLIVSVDRCERGQGTQAALREIEDEFGLRASSIVNIHEVVEYLQRTTVDGRMLIDEACRARIDAYFAEYGPQ